MEGLPSDSSDITPPVIMLLGPTLIRLEANVDVYAELGCQAWDSFEGNLTAAVVLQSDVPHVHLLGTFLVNYTVADQASNIARMTREVTIVDTLAPELRLLGSARQQLLVGRNWTEPGFEAIDAFEGNVTDRVAVTSNFTTELLPGDVVLVFYFVSDSSGNEVLLHRTVTISEAANPSTFIGIIVGAAVGAVLVITVIVVVMAIRRKTRQKATKSHSLKPISSGMCSLDQHCLTLKIS